VIPKSLTVKTRSCNLNETPNPPEITSCRSGPGTSCGPGTTVIGPGGISDCRCGSDLPHQFGCAERVSRKSVRRKNLGGHLVFYSSPPRKAHCFGLEGEPICPGWIMTNTPADGRLRVPLPVLNFRRDGIRRFFAIDLEVVVAGSLQQFRRSSISYLDA
jgi:hypothetical protein